jgi:hypothetical protein
MVKTLKLKKLKFVTAFIYLFIILAAGTISFKRGTSLYLAEFSKNYESHLEASKAISFNESNPIATKI